MVFIDWLNTQPIYQVAAVNIVIAVALLSNYPVVTMKHTKLIVLLCLTVHIYITCASSDDTQGSDTQTTAVDDEAGKADSDCGCNKISRDNLVSKSSDSSQTCDTNSKDECKLEQSEMTPEDEDDVAVEVEEEGDSPAQSEEETTSDEKADKGKQWSADMVIDTKEDKAVVKTNPMVLIEGGEFFMGTYKAFIPPDGESPLRPVKINTFYVDKKEVSNEEFAAFVKATNYVTEVSASTQCG